MQEKGTKLTSPLLLGYTQRVKCLEMSPQALDRGTERPERIPGAEMDRFSHCKANPIMRNPEGLPHSFCGLGIVFISPARNHVRSSETKQNQCPFFFSSSCCGMISNSGRFFMLCTTSMLELIGRTIILNSNRRCEQHCCPPTWFLFLLLVYS